MPNTTSLERLAALTGVVGVILFAISVVVAGTPPDVGAPASEIASYLADHDGDIRAAQYLGGLALILLSWFTGTLWAHLRRAEGQAGRLAQIYLVATIAIGAVFLVQSALLVVATYEPGAEVSRGFFRLAVELGPHLAFLFAASYAALALVALRYAALPRAFGLYAAAFAVYELLEGACILNVDGELAPGGAFNDVGPLLFVVATVWASLALFLRIRAPRETTTP
jgi:hypothetical protein